jgi:hypothetical protein
LTSTEGRNILVDGEKETLIFIYRYGGRALGHVKKRDKFEDPELYGILKEEWSRAKEIPQ